MYFIYPHPKKKLNPIRVTLIKKYLLKISFIKYFVGRKSVVHDQDK